MCIGQMKAMNGVVVVPMYEVIKADIYEWPHLHQADQNNLDTTIYAMLTEVDIREECEYEKFSS